MTIHVDGNGPVRSEGPPETVLKICKNIRGKAKSLFLLFVLLGICWPTLPVSPARAAEDVERPAAASKADFSYENSYLTEDVTWRGVVVIRGSLTVAPQATVRVEPGTEIRFAKSPILRQPPRMVVMGRIHCSGTIDRPVIFGYQAAGNASGEWGGILLVATEKRNQFEHVRIEGAQTGIEARFSTFAGRNLAVVNCSAGMLLRDSTAELAGLSVRDCATGLEIHDSEVEMRDGRIFDNGSGIVGSHSSLVLEGMELNNNSRQGMMADSCRIRFSSCAVSGNGAGLVVRGGDGQILLSRFVANRETALQVSGGRLKINRSLFSENRGGGIRLDDGRSAVWGCSFSDNGTFHLAVAGAESVSAVLNWWGTGDESSIAALISGPVAFFPWLTEKPPIP